jgi:hypothetical protein
VDALLLDALTDALDDSVIVNHPDSWLLYKI